MQLLLHQISHWVLYLLSETVYSFPITYVDLYLDLTYIYLLYLLFAIADVTDKSDEDYVYLHCSS